MMVDEFNVPCHQYAWHFHLSGAIDFNQHSHVKLAKRQLPNSGFNKASSLERATLF